MPKTFEYRFEWDLEKARKNKNKHGVVFEQCAAVFLDSAALTTFDPEHSDGEDRWITLGMDRAARLVVVCHTFMVENPSSALIRIISARKATKHEAAQYARKFENEG